eukprot:620714-Pyramimonas_sp.AAC.1
MAAVVTASESAQMVLRFEDWLWYLLAFALGGTSVGPSPWVWGMIGRCPDEAPGSGRHMMLRVRATWQSYSTDVHLVPPIATERSPRAVAVGIVVAVGSFAVIDFEVAAGKERGDGCMLNPWPLHRIILLLLLNELRMLLLLLNEARHQLTSPKNEKEAARPGIA